MESMARLRDNKLILALLCCTTVIYVGILSADLVSETKTNTRILKYLGDIFCLFIVLASWRHAYKRRDIEWLLTGFLFAMAADALFLFAGQLEMGVICFCFAQTAFIRRYRKKAFTPCFKVLVAALAFYVTGKLAGWQLPYLYILAAIYAAFLFLTAYYGFSSDLPKPNKTLVKAGMVAFILNDANNAAMYIFAPNSPAIAIAAYLVWVFYIPALALLALSAYDYS